MCKFICHDSWFITTLKNLLLNIVVQLLRVGTGSFRNVQKLHVIAGYDMLYEHATSHQPCSVSVTQLFVNRFKSMKVASLTSSLLKYITNTVQDVIQMHILEASVCTLKWIYVARTSLRVFLLDKETHDFVRQISASDRVELKTV